MNAGEAILARLAAGDCVAERIVIIVAHPDDETIGLGAQLGRFDDALLVHVTDGAPRDGEDARNYGFASVADYAAARQAELAAALRAGGAARLRGLVLGIPDKEAGHDLAGLARRIAGMLRAEAAACVFTHAYEGGHPDHDSAAFAVHAACRLAASPPAIIEMPFYHRSDGRIPSCFSIVIPAEAGIHFSTDRAADRWVPAFAGTTIWSCCGNSAPTGRP
jgi:LmbE family N-acetylglucosaminyl deacetylase